jgi:hypothetical protein
VKLSETPSGLAWLANFSESDLCTATTLLDSLRFVSLDTLRNELVAGLESLREEEKIEMPALLLPERKLNDLKEDKPLDKETAVAYVDFHPGAKISSTPGSEAIIGTVLRDFAVAGSNDVENPWIEPDAQLDQLRGQRCRSIVLVTDFCGTGNQVSVLADTIARNKTFKSWRSLGLIRIHVLAFAATPTALRTLRNHPNIDVVHTIEATPDFDTAPWPKKLKLTIVDLCQRESRSKAYALGFRQSGGLLATVRRAPNNLPAVFIQTKDWSPLFPNRRVPPEVAADLAGYKASEPVDALAARVGQPRISVNQRLAYMRPTSRELLATLLLVHRSTRTLDELAAEIGTSMARTEALVDTLHHFGFIDGDLKITTEGRQEILAQKRARRRTTAGLDGSDATYYPHSLK